MNVETEVLGLAWVADPEARCGGVWYWHDGCFNVLLCTVGAVSVKEWWDYELQLAGREASEKPSHTCIANMLEICRRCRQQGSSDAGPGYFQKYDEQLYRQQNPIDGL